MPSSTTDFPTSDASTAENGTAGPRSFSGAAAAGAGTAAGAGPVPPAALAAGAGAARTGAPSRSSLNDAGLRLRMRAEWPDDDAWSCATKSMASPLLGTRPPSIMSWRWAWSTNTMMLPEPSLTLKLMPLPFLKGRGSFRTWPTRRTTPKFMVVSISPIRTSAGSRVRAMR